MATQILKLTFAVVLFPIMLSAQSGQEQYMKIDYLDVDQSQLTEFTDRIVPELKEYHGIRIESGEIYGWAIYQVVYSGSDSNHYNYVSIITSPSIRAFDEFNTEYSDEILKHSEQNMYQLSQSELWTVRNSLVSDMVTKPSNYLMMDYMHVNLGRELEYQMLEDEVAKPLHEERMSNDKMEAWEMYQLMTPGGLHYGYNFATGNYFSDLDHIEFGFNEELIRSQNPDVNLSEFFDHVWSTRDLVKSQMWQLVDYVQSTDDEGS